MSTLTGAAGARLALPANAPEAIWLDMRRQGITATDLAAIVGVSPYQGPLHVWCDKLPELGIPAPPVNVAMRLGSFLEPFVLELYSEARPGIVLAAKPGMYCSTTEPWRMCTPDALARIDGEPTLIEAKTSTSRSEEEWGAPGSDEIPFSYLCQVTWAADILGCRRWELAMFLLDDRRLLLFEGAVDPGLAASLRKAAHGFRDTFLLPKCEPPADGLPGTTELLKRRFTGKPARTRIVKEIDQAALQWRDVYLSCGDQIGELKEAQRAAGNRLRQELIAVGGTVGQVAGFDVVTWIPNVHGVPALCVKKGQ